MDNRAAAVDVLGSLAARRYSQSFPGIAPTTTQSHTFWFVRMHAQGYTPVPTSRSR